MNEKELLEYQKRVAEIMAGNAKNPQVAEQKLLEFQQELQLTKEPETAEEELLTMMVNEALGDCRMRVKKVGDAEKSYQAMLKCAMKLYERDREHNDFRLGTAYYKFGCFYRNILGCHMLSPKAKELNDAQKQGLQIAEQCFQSAVDCTKASAVKGKGLHVELHGHCFEALMILHQAVGNYEKAVLCGKEAVRINKRVYDVKDDVNHGVRLANVMNGLGGVYFFSKDLNHAMECMEDAVYVLEEHEEKEPVKVGVMLARYYTSLGSCYAGIEEEKENAEGAYKKGLERLVKINEQTKNRYIDDLLQSYVFVGDYYKRVQKEYEAKAHYTWAMKLASDLFKATKKPKYEAMLNHLKGKV